MSSASRTPVVLLVAFVILAVSSGGEAAPGKRSGPVRRAPPPSGSWDKATAGTFFADAFGELDGERPDFANKSGQRVSAGDPAAEPTTTPAGGFRWSSLVSEGTLTDEVKDRRSIVAEAIASPSGFKGGGYDTARQAYSSVALAFGVIAAYDADVRWKKDAATARDLFARVGFNCKVGTDQSFAESKARFEDLEALLDGNSPQGKPERDEDFAWSQVAARPALMQRLEDAEKTLGASTADKGDFTKAAEQILHEAEMVAVIGEVIQQSDFEFYDDETYRGYSSAMRDAAVQLRDAVQKGDYESARAGVGSLKKSCDACHGDYRS